MVFHLHSMVDNLQLPRKRAEGASSLEALAENFPNALLSPLVITNHKNSLDIMGGEINFIS